MSGIFFFFWVWRKTNKVFKRRNIDELCLRLFFLKKKKQRYIPPLYIIYYYHHSTLFNFTFDLKNIYWTTKSFLIFTPSKHFTFEPFLYILDNSYWHIQHRTDLLIQNQKLAFSPVRSTSIDTFSSLVMLLPYGAPNSQS